MFRLVYSLILYLAGIAGILYFRPSLMFQKNGQWKEFAIRNGETTTVFPFWMFCILWAVVSFLIIQVVISRTGVTTTASAITTIAAIQKTVQKENKKVKEDSESEDEKLALRKSNVSTIAKTIRPRVKEEENSADEYEEYVAPLPVKKRSASASASKEKVVEVMKPGYYKMDPTSVNSRGIPRYIYMGPEEPEEED
jgi:hypothetical protein